VFVRAPGSGGGAPFTGRVWPGDVHYPDFVAAGGGAAAGWWAQLVAGFQTLIPFDGLWIDMNEVRRWWCQFGGSGGGHVAAARGGGLQ
jgi:alpha-glucosidase (family GH31 glycosyl hydrolase)